MTEKKSPIISFKNFSFQYRAQKKPTLKEINLDIYPGEGQRMELVKQALDAFSMRLGLPLGDV